MANVFATPVKGTTVENLAVQIATGQSASDVVWVGAARLSGVITPVLEALTAELEVQVSVDGSTWYTLEYFNGSAVVAVRLPIANPAVTHAFALDTRPTTPFAYFRLVAQDGAHAAKVQTGNRALTVAIVAIEA